VRRCPGCGGCEGTGGADRGGIAFRDGDAVVETPIPSPVGVKAKSLDELPMPARDLLRVDRHTNMFTSRGCPYKCLFCASTRYWPALRFFSADYVAREIRTLVDDFGVDYITFHDDLFLANLPRLRELVDLLDQNGVLNKRIRFSCSASVTTIGEETAALMKRMNIVTVAMGLESGNDGILKYLKGDVFSVEKNASAVRILHKNGIHAHGSFVIGSISLDTLPGASAFVPLAVANIGAGTVINYSPVTNLIGQSGRVVVIGPQPLLEGSLGTNSSMLLNLYGNPGASYKLLTTTNIASTNSWSVAGSVTLTNLFQVINLGGATNPMPRFAAYAATKAAVVRLTETLAEELREFHIDVNAVAPGALQTRLLKQVLAAGPEKAGQEFYAKNQKWAEQGAADPRLGAALCVFLASRESDGITGKLISAQWDPWREFPRLRDQMRNDIYTLRRIVPEDRGQKWS